MDPTGTAGNPQAMKTRFSGFSPAQDADNVMVIQSFIDGEWHMPKSTIPLENPATGRVIARVPRNTADDVDKGKISKKSELNCMM